MQVQWNLNLTDFRNNGSCLLGPTLNSIALLFRPAAYRHTRVSSATVQTGSYRHTRVSRATAQRNWSLQIYGHTDHIYFLYKFRKVSQLHVIILTYFLLSLGSESHIDYLHIIISKLNRLKYLFV
jgi:hypothetical protein